MYKTGMIVKRGIEYGVVENASGSCSVNWFHSHSTLKHAWWNEGDLEIIEDPTQKYQDMANKQKIIVTTNKNDRKEFLMKDYYYIDIAQYVVDLGEKYNATNDTFEYFNMGDVACPFELKDSFEIELETRDTKEKIIIALRME